MVKDNKIRGRARGGRGFHRPNNQTNKGPSFEKKEDYKFAPHIQGKAQQATYATVKDAVIQYIQENFQNGYDVAQCLDDMMKIDFSSQEPKRQISTEIDKEKRDLKQSGFDMIFQDKHMLYLNQIQALEYNFK